MAMIGKVVILLVAAVGVESLHYVKTVRRRMVVQYGEKIKRVRQHLNPLSSEAQRSIQLDDDWFCQAFDDPKQRLVIDVGCAMGGWCIESAAELPGTNFLGIEIRPGAYENAVERLKRTELTNCFFLKANANIDLDRILQDALSSGAKLEAVCFQFPDPHFKKRHHKRRVVTAELVASIQKAFASSPHPSPFVYLASDVLEAADHMRAVFREHATLLKERGEAAMSHSVWGGVQDSPFPVATERERAVLAGLGETSTEKHTVYRALFDYI